jgi:phage repressor protein C with HTH and peptisase S24 domain
MDVKQIRHKNAHALAQEVGSWVELARLADTNPKYLSQIVSEKGKREVGDKLARKLEQGCGKPHGWMDQDHSTLFSKARDIIAQQRRDEIKAATGETHERWISDYHLSQISEDELASSLRDIANHMPDKADAINRYADKLTSGNHSPTVISHPAKPVLAWDEETPLPAGEFVLIPRLDVQLSAGNGTVIYDVNEKQPHAFRADWLRKRKLNPDNICLMYACGDSMEDYIQDGDTLLVDVTQKTISENVVYALRYGDELRVKRLFKRPDGGLRIVSDNKKYPEELVSAADANAYISIIGRIVWRGG